MGTCQEENCEYNSKKHLINHIHKVVVGGEVNGIPYDAHIVYEIEEV